MQHYIDEFNAVKDERDREKYRATIDLIIRNALVFLGQYSGNPEYERNARVLGDMFLEYQTQWRT